MSCTDTEVVGNITEWCVENIAHRPADCQCCGIPVSDGSIRSFCPKCLSLACAAAGGDEQAQTELVRLGGIANAYETFRKATKGLTYAERIAAQLAWQDRGKGTPRTMDGE